MSFGVIKLQIRSLPDLSQGNFAKLSQIQHDGFVKPNADAIAKVATARQRQEDQLPGGRD